MDADTYQKLAADFSRTGSFHIANIMEATLGLNGEAGEVAEAIKKTYFHGAFSDPLALKLELGDVLWYTTYMCSLHGWSLSDVMKLNLQKLQERRST